MRIVFIADGDPNDNRLWSGTIKQMYTQLKSAHEVFVIDVSNRSVLLTAFNRCVTAIVRWITKKKYNASYSTLNARRESRIVETHMHRLGQVDAVFCPAKSGSIAYAKIQAPIIYLTDATFEQMVGYYDHLTDLCRWTVYEGTTIERKAIGNSACVICASTWAQRSVITDYNKSESQTGIIPFGANIDEFVSANKDMERINILFCGVDWKRKGGSVAVETVKELQRRGIDAHLFLVGCRPPCEFAQPFIHTVGFLNKNNECERKRLQEIYGTMHFLLLPTVAECAGIVFAEASGYGIPSITYDTGGVGTYVVDNVNGFKLPLSAGYSEFATCIERCAKDAALYKKLCDGAKEYYNASLNWTSWKEAFDEVLNEVCDEKI